MAVNYASEIPSRGFGSAVYTQVTGMEYLIYA